MPRSCQASGIACLMQCITCRVLDLRCFQHPGILQIPWRHHCHHSSPHLCGRRRLRAGAQHHGVPVCLASAGRAEHPCSQPQVSGGCAPAFSTVTAPGSWRCEGCPTYGTSQPDKAVCAVTCVRWHLAVLDQKDGSLYVANGLVLTSLFFSARVICYGAGLWHLWGLRYLLSSVVSCFLLVVAPIPSQQRSEAVKSDRKAWL